MSNTGYVLTASQVALNNGGAARQESNPQYATNHICVTLCRHSNPYENGPSHEPSILSSYSYV